MEPEVFEDCSQAFNVFLLCSRINDDIIQIDQTGQIINFPKQLVINHWKVAGALLSPNSQCPYSESSVLFRGFLNGGLPKPGQEVHSLIELLPQRASMTSCIQGSGKASFRVQAFSLQKSIQNLSPPSFFQTRTTALLHADLLGLITPTSSMIFHLLEKA